MLSSASLGFSRSNMLSGKTRMHGTKRFEVRLHARRFAGGPPSTKIAPFNNAGRAQVLMIKELSFSPISADHIRILIIDDDKNHADVVAESLERVGYDCVIATSGAAGA